VIMAENALIWIGMGTVFGGLFFVVGLFLLGLGLMNAWTLVRTVFGSETTIDDIDTDADVTWVKLVGSISSVPRPVETLDDQSTGLYRIRAVLKNRWNALKKNRQVTQVLSEATELDGVVLRDERGETCLLTAEASNGDQWGQAQADTNHSFLSIRRDFVTDEFQSEQSYSDEQVPREIRDALERRYDADADFDTSSVGVSLTLFEETVEAGERIHLIGAVEPSEITEDDLGASTTGADRSALQINLTPFTTVTDGSWRTLAWDTGKRVILRVPFGAGLMVAGIVLAVQLFQRGGLL